MKKWLERLGFGCCVSCCCSCSEAPQEHHDLSLKVEGKQVDDMEVSEGLTISLDRADFAFGPLYLCPGAQAGQLCDLARMEWLDSAVVDGLDENEQVLGTLEGVTGPTRSWMFDFGIHSLLTELDSTSSEAAKELGDRSLRLEGEAVISGSTVPFTVEVVVQQLEDSEKGVQVVRKSSSDQFDYEITKDSSELKISWDPSTWIATLEPSDFCDPECPDSIAFDEESDVAQKIGQAMVSGERPIFDLR